MEVVEAVLEEFNELDQLHQVLVVAATVGSGLPKEMKNAF